MSISRATRETVRQRANFACEYCGISETDAGSELTLNHYRPSIKGGNDALENLIYCCHRCNEYKSDYFPISSDQPLLWNPRLSKTDEHFLELNDGYVKGITNQGELQLDF